MKYIVKKCQNRQKWRFFAFSRGYTRFDGFWSLSQRKPGSIETSIFLKIVDFWRFFDKKLKKLTIFEKIKKKWKKLKIFQIKPYVNNYLINNWKKIEKNWIFCQFWSIFVVFWGSKIGVIFDPQKMKKKSLFLTPQNGPFFWLIFTRK